MNGIRVGAGALLACLALAATAVAAKPPELGWWRGASDDGTRIAFAVERVDGKRALIDPIMGCDTGAGQEFGELEQFGEIDFTFADESAAPSAHGASPIRRSGRIDGRSRTITGPRYPDLPGREDETYDSPLKGRLTGDHARLKLDGSPIWSSSWCTDASDPQEGEVLEVEAVPGASRIGAGVWRAEGLLPFGDLVDYAAGLFYVSPSGVLGNFKGIFLGPATPPPDRRPNPLFSPWPLPCFEQNVSDTAFESTGGMAYDFNEIAMVDATVIPGDGSLHTLGGRDPDVTNSYAWVDTNGAFTSPSDYEGSYQITEGAAIFNPNWCIDVSIPFEAHRTGPPAPAVIGDLESPGPKVTPGRDYLTIPFEPTDYVALGDSYSSGEGVPPFDPETATAANRCHRSQRAYSRRFNPPGYRLRRSFFACSGGTTENLGRLDAAGAVGGTPQAGEPAIQLARLSPGDWGAVDMVTLTIGGNDAQFASVLSACVIRACQRGKLAKRIKRRIAGEVPPLLAASYGAIRRTAPNASVFVLGYPQLFPSHPRRRCPVGKRLVSRSKQAFLRERGEQLNDVIAEQAAAAGLHFIGVERSFAGHEPCGPKAEWIHGLVLRRGQRAFSFHPNGKGQRAYADRLISYFGCLSDHGFPFKRSGVPEGVGPAGAPPKGCR